MNRFCRYQVLLVKMYENHLAADKSDISFTKMPNFVLLDQYRQTESVLALKHQVEPGKNVQFLILLAGLVPLCAWALPPVPYTAYPV